MRLINKLLNKIIFTDNNYLVWVEYINTKYIGFLHTWKFDSMLFSKTTNLFNCSIIRYSNNYLIFKGDDNGTIVFFNKENLETITFNFSNYNLRPYYYGSSIILKNIETKEVFYFDWNEKKILPTGFGQSLFDYSDDTFGILSFNNHIECHNLNTKAQLWQIHTPDLNYSREGHHIAALTPKNDVPYRCLFHNNLLLALFRTHTAAIDLPTGRVVWEYNIGSEYRDFLDGDILNLNQGAYFYKLNANTGDLLYENNPYSGSFEQKLVGKKTNFVFDDTHIYFCMTEKKEIITMRKDSFEIEAVHKIDDPGAGILYPTEPIYLQKDKLFITLEYSEPQTHTEILVYQI